MTGERPDRGARGSQRVPPQILRAAAQALARHRRAVRDGVVSPRTNPSRTGKSTVGDAGSTQRSDRSPGGWSGPRDERRDPAPIGALYASISAAEGWREPVSVFALQNNWESIVGSALASRVRVYHYRPDDPRHALPESGSTANPRPVAATLPGLSAQDSREDDSRDRVGGLLVLQVVDASFSVQLGYLMPQVHDAIDRALGHGVVGRIEVIGPDQPRLRGRRPGRRRVKGGNG